MDEKPQEHYKLPHDTQELNRLDVQHKMWKLMVGGLYPSELDSVVGQLMTRSQPKIMDVGCGSGIWAIEMAERFPQAQIVGIDITPLKHGPTPPNFIFKQLNLAEGLPIEYTSQFDIVHCRCVCQHVREPQILVNDIVRCAKHKGLVLIPDGEWIGFDEYRRPLVPFVYNRNLSMEENVTNTRKVSSYAGWLMLFGKATRSPKYQLPNVLLQNTGRVRDIIFRELWAPTGWAGKGLAHGEEIGKITRLNMKEFFKTSMVTIIDQGVPLPVVEAWRERAMEELDERRHNVWYYTSAIVSETSRSRL
ncbi:hypothetical protein D9756_002323 [Leucocoprinus leucothites]|uniref:S-adenosyl-L-methionine-dependent methyltransferase n=1 Tax=Leucocoprinus leucothites TaxID=201217 RepID=A0A8H5LLI4_9AGAR|nr:hypothetical protein D9756_002323 [Leucoagaricus leucothites]